MISDFAILYNGMNLVIVTLILESNLTRMDIENIHYAM